MHLEAKFTQKIDAYSSGLMASDVLSDAILSFELLKINGIIGFDDYLWKLPNTNNLLTNPKIAIDSFTNIFALRSAIFRTPNHQVYIKKTY